MSNDHLEQRALSSREERELYGERRTPIGTCFKHLDTTEDGEALEHYYKQEAYFVLHVLKGHIINTLAEGFFNTIKNRRTGFENVYQEATLEEFESAMRQTIFEMEIYKYLKPI